MYLLNIFDHSFSIVILYICPLYIQLNIYILALLIDFVGVGVHIYRLLIVTSTKVVVTQRQDSMGPAILSACA